MSMLVVLCSAAKSCSILCHSMDCANQASPSFTVSRSLLKFISVESGMPSNHLILCCPLFLLLSVFPNMTVFSKESALCIRWPNYWSISISISRSSEYSGWFPLGLTGLISSYVAANSCFSTINMCYLYNNSLKIVASVF